MIEAEPEGLSGIAQVSCGWLFVGLKRHLYMLAIFKKNAVAILLHDQTPHLVFQRLSGLQYAIIFNAVTDSNPELIRCVRDPRDTLVYAL